MFCFLFVLFFDFDLDILRYFGHFYVIFGRAAGTAHSLTLLRLLVADSRFVRRGTMGSGLFVASGKAIATGGPASALLVYMVIGALVYCIMISLAEMAAWHPILDSLTHFASRFVDDSTSITVGYSYLTHMEIPSVFNASHSNGQVNNMYIRTITEMENNKSRRIRKQ